MKRTKRNPAARAYFRAFYDGNRLNFGLTALLTLLGIPVTLSVSWLLGELLDAAALGDYADSSVSCPRRASAPFPGKIPAATCPSSPTTPAQLRQTIWKAASESLTTRSCSLAASA